MLLIMMIIITRLVIDKTTSLNNRKEDHGPPCLPAQHVQSTFAPIESLVPPNREMGKCAN